MKKILPFLSPACFLLLTLRICIFGASIGEAVALLAAAGAFSFHSWLKQQEVQPTTEEMKKDIAHLKDSVSSLKMANNTPKFTRAPNG